jgi:hypothetical protein
LSINEPSSFVFVVDQHLFEAGTYRQKSSEETEGSNGLYDSDLVGDVQGVVVGSQLHVRLLLAVGPVPGKRNDFNRMSTKAHGQK